MPYREQLAERLRIALCEYGGIEERKMFGALCMTKRGNMPCRAMQQAVMFCVRANQIETALAQAYQLNDPVRTGVLRKKKGACDGALFNVFSSGTAINAGCLLNLSRVDLTRARGPGVRPECKRCHSAPGSKASRQALADRKSENLVRWDAR